MNHCGTKRLETERLVLRRFTVEDAEAMYRNWAADPEVTRFLTWPTHGSVEVTRMVLTSWVESYQKDDYYQWAIVLKENGNQPIGSISAVELNENVSLVQIGYCLGREWWHQGIMSEAFSRVIDFFFEEVGVNRVEARHDVNNPRSGLVMKKCVLKYEGTMRSCDRNNTGIVDACWYGLLRAQWENKKRPAADVIIREEKLTDGILQLLIRFSQDWEAENSCTGYRANLRSDIEGKRIFVAYDGDQPVGYLFGEAARAKSMTSVMPEGTRYFEVDELYVIPERRSQGIGRKLFYHVENVLKNEVEYLDLSTATKNWQAILHFYIEELGMNFWSARLYRKIGSQHK